MHADDATAGVRLRLDGVRKVYPDGTVAVHDVTLDVVEGELIALVGPSGCGKSTTLRMVNRLIEPTGGRILLDGVDVTHSDPVKLRRSMGYVIQASGLFPHRTVRANVGTVPELLGWPKQKLAMRVDELLELVGLEPGHFGDRYPRELSGGQQQRVGVARALAADPPVLLMDEPFGAVDPIVRDRLQTEFRRIQGELRKTVLFVTHDIDEAVRLADRIAVMEEGRLRQVADPATVLGAPANAFVADFVGSDRGLRRLAVTPIEPADLEHPPTVAPSDTATQARQAIVGSDLDYAVVVDAQGRLHGWVSVASLTGGTVKDVARRFDVVLASGSSLRKGFAEMVQHDAGWVPVMDGETYLGVLTPGSVHAALRRTAAEPDEVPEPGSASKDEPVRATA